MRMFSLLLGLAACSIGLLIVGCVPVQSVLGRPAAVLPKGETWAYRGPGGIRFDWEAIDEVAGDGSLESNISGLPYYFIGGTGGLDKDTEYSVAVVLPSQVMASIRHQFLGEPFGFTPPQGESRFLVDASIEAGASLYIPLVANASWADVYLGVNVSVPMSKVTPYLTYRYHWNWANGEDYHWSSQQHMFFVGLDFLKREQRRAIAVELFYGRPPDMTPEGDVVVYETVGINVIFRRFNP